MSDVTITATRNGSYHVQGKVKIVDPRGNVVEYDGDETWLCRCGGSATKPFCDGTHSRIGFKAAEAAVAASDGK